MRHFIITKGKAKNYNTYSDITRVELVPEAVAEGIYGGVVILQLYTHTDS